MRSTKMAEITSDDSRAERFSATERLIQVSDAGEEDTQYDHDGRCRSEGTQLNCDLVTGLRGETKNRSSSFFHTSSIDRHCLGTHLMH